MADIQFLSQLLATFPNFADHVSSVFGPQAAAGVQQTAAKAGIPISPGPGIVAPPGSLGTAGPPPALTPHQIVSPGKPGTVITGPGHVNLPPGGLSGAQPPAGGLPTPTPAGPGVQLPIASPQLPGGGNFGQTLAAAGGQPQTFNSQLSGALSGSRPRALPR